MHTNNLVHRDIKLDNVVFSAAQCKGDFSKMQIKLIDFGFSTFSIQGMTDLNDFPGTPYYISPEII